VANTFGKQLKTVPINSRSKGKAGELEAAAILRDMGYEARRGQQHAGGPDSPDLVTNFPFHLEVKRVQRLNLEVAYQQATKDAGGVGAPPAVLHRRNRGKWLLTMSLEDFHLYNKNQNKESEDA